MIQSKSLKIYENLYNLKVGPSPINKEEVVSNGSEWVKTFIKNH